jgi:hypothetical protein
MKSEIKDRQSRKYSITLNNPLVMIPPMTHEQIKQEIGKLGSVVYWCMADEIGLEEKTPHTHIYLYSDSPIRFSTIKNRGVLLVFVTGMRVGELSTLKPEDIQITDKNSFIHVCRTEIHYSEEDEQGQRKNVVGVQDFPKSEAGDRYIILNSFAIQILQRIKELNPNPKRVSF